MTSYLCSCISYFNDIYLSYQFRVQRPILKHASKLWLYKTYPCFAQLSKLSKQSNKPFEYNFDVDFSSFSTQLMASEFWKWSCLIIWTIVNVWTIVTGPILMKFGMEAAKR